MEKINPLDFESRYYMFDEINKAHFDGRLPRPEISIENFENRNVVGENLLAVFSPPGLRCNVPTIRLPNGPGFYADIWEIAVAMAHEMIHYSNYLKGVDDIEMRGNIQWHTRAFADEAKQHNYMAGTSIWLDSLATKMQRTNVQNQVQYLRLAGLVIVLPAPILI